jgi:hypothetical protein
LSPRGLSIRLEKLENLRGGLRVVDESAHPPIAIYKLDQSAPPTEGDVSLVYDALRSFNYIRKLYAFTGRAAISKADLTDLLHVYYSRLYPYFLWCLYYGSKAETVYAEQAITKFYLDELKGKVSGTIHPRGREEFLRKLIALSWGDLKEKELKNGIAEGKAFFVSQFPSDLRDLAGSFFYFYLDKRFDSWERPLEEFKLIVDNKYVRRDFENHYGQKIPRYRLAKFLNLLKSSNF